MLATPESKLAQYHRVEIGGWDLMSWAASIDPSEIGDAEALDALLNLDDFFANGHHEEVEALLLRTIPANRRHALGEILILDAEMRLEAGSLSPSEFVSFFLETYLNEIEVPGDHCSDWICRLFNRNNGYGFLELEKMDRTELLAYLRSLKQ